MRNFPLILLLIPLPTFGQTPKVEVSLRIGLGSLRVFGSNYADDGTNVGISVETRVHPRLGLEFEIDRMLNLHPRPVPCGLSVTCTGSGVEGTRSAFHFSGNLLYYFRTSAGVEPYVVGGLGSLRSVRAHAITFVGPTEGRIVQQPNENDSGVSIGFGGGVRVPVGNRFTVRLEFRLYDSSIRSRSNLGLILAGVRLGYHW